MDVRPDKALVVPSTIEDFQAILDNSNVMNTGSPAIGEISGDNIFLDLTRWQSTAAGLKNIYVWDRSQTLTDVTSDWNFPYQQVFYANVVLDGIQDLPLNNENTEALNNLRGGALFYRAHAFYNLLQVFGVPYTDATANTDLGIVLKTTSDVWDTYERSTVSECYNQIINDLIESVSLLPPIPLYKTRPSKTSSYGLLARIMLILGNHDKAREYADLCLQIYNHLIDYNSLNTSGTGRPFQRFNNETIFYHTMISYSPLSQGLVSRELYDSYESDDIRKVAFFNVNGENITWKGMYSGALSNFSGIATDEIYLIRAESNARLGNTQLALQDLNAVLIKRWKTDTYIPFETSDNNDALTKILVERRKQLLYRGIRWSDLRRLNQEDGFATILVRELGDHYMLPPNDLRYTLPIPASEIIASGIEQNKW
ncbi:RagB/SusD family nutrient uptake outer membrane protein [Parapedobacter sp. 2B3]|uniref:RagB/SusD family nutrient uptake outer membrane protein n=1 Tax=Parapedobacter sp. 2B3 TaxID=3342381 RepID=UPI0035B5E045